jgi:hypothetical protein
MLLTSTTKTAPWVTQARSKFGSPGLWERGFSRVLQLAREPMVEVRRS